MSHFQTILFLPPTTRNLLTRASALLAPYEEAPENPKSRWDFWLVGGRWDGLMKYGRRLRRNNNRTGLVAHQQLTYNACPVGDIKQKRPPFAVITPAGEWAARGQMGWFGMVSKETKDWPQVWGRLCRRFGDHLALSIDCHI